MLKICSVYKTTKSELVRFMNYDSHSISMFNTQFYVYHKYLGLLDSVTSLQLHFYSSHFSISWDPPFSLIKADVITYCVKALDRQNLPVISECNVRQPLYRFRKAMYQHLSSVNIEPTNRIGTGKTATLIIKGKVRLILTQVS